MTANVKANILKVPHHGSRTTPLEFFPAVAAEVSVISVGEGNRFGHPVSEVVAALSAEPLYRTDRDGRVTVRSNGSDIRVTTER